MMRYLSHMLSLQLLIVSVSVSLSGIGMAAPPASTHVIQDMAGRMVTIPKTVERIVTLGPVPVLNSFIFALGKSDSIVNGLPLFARTPRHKYHALFAPTLAGRPVVQGPGMDPDIELLLQLRPDVILTMDKDIARILEKKGFATLVLAWRHSEDVKTTMLLLGKVLDREERALNYLGYVDGLLNRIAEAISDIAETRRPNVLFCSFKSMTQPHLIADWWIRKAGGISVTENSRIVESLSFSVEHVLKWNPDILIVSTPGEVIQAYQDTRLRTVLAVQNRNVFSIPSAAHPWGYRTVELPLTVFWAARLFHSQRMAHLDLGTEMRAFYGRFFGYTLRDDQVEEILSGIP